jgi:hypothetical protein
MIPKGSLRLSVKLALHDGWLKLLHSYYDASLRLHRNGTPYLYIHYSFIIRPLFVLERQAMAR